MTSLPSHCFDFTHILSRPLEDTFNRPFTKFLFQLYLISLCLKPNFFTPDWKKPGPEKVKTWHHASVCKNQIIYRACRFGPKSFASYLTFPSPLFFQWSNVHTRFKLHT